jgi:hypothetical protein
MARQQGCQASLGSLVVFVVIRKTGPKKASPAIPPGGFVVYPDESDLRNCLD